MRFVIYDDESLEPITVVSLPITERDALDRRRYRLALPPRPLSMSQPAPDFEPIRVVDIWFEPFCRGEQRSVICFTQAADLAMLLNPAWLPGQRRAVDYLMDQNDSLTKLLMTAVLR